MSDEHCEDFDDPDYTLESEIKYVVKHIAYCGMSHVIDEFEDREDAVDRAKKRLAWCKEHGCSIDVITEDEEWEVCEPEGCLMVPDYCGLLVIRCVEVPARGY